MRTRRTVQPHILALTMAATLAVAPGAVAAEPDTAAEHGAVDEAKDAVANSDFDALVPLLEPLVADGDAPAMADLLYALGVLYEAPDGADDDYFETVNRHIERALESDAGVEVDPLLYPPEFVARVEELRRRIDDSDSELTAANEPAVFYFERRVETRSRLPLFFPGGVGQFYDDATFRGITFATVQGLGLAANVVGHWMIESMRTETGHIPAEDFSRARDWRRLQYAGLATFAGGWLISIVDANLGFEPRTVRIRTLDSPPEELDTFSHSRTGPDLPLQLQWSVAF